MSNHSLTRRDFLATSAAGAALAAMPTISRAATSPNERLRLGFIGVGGRAQAASRFGDPPAKRRTRRSRSPRSATCSTATATRLRREGRSEKVGHEPTKTGDYRDILNDPSIDAVVIATPDHWHAKQTIDALAAGKHVYCEKPMTHSVDEALAVLKAWKESGRVMQVGVQSTSLPVWKAINERIRNGDIGKVLQYQTEFFRNSDMGQWRYYELTEDMTPKNIDWQMFLGTRVRSGAGHAVRSGRVRPVAVLLAVRCGHVHRSVRPSHDVDAAGHGPAVPRPRGRRGRHLPGVRRPRRARRGHRRRRFSGGRAGHGHGHHVLRGTRRSSS